MRWIEIILHERLGQAFTLALVEDGLLRLELPGTSGYIQFDTAPETFSRNDSELPCARWSAIDEGWESPFGADLPAPGVSTLQAPLIVKEEFGYRVHYDLLGCIYWILSRTEEVGRTDLDEHGRFFAFNSHAVRFDYLERPIVDEWLLVLRNVIEAQWPELMLRQQQFVIKVSHDVDEPSRYAFRTLPRLIRAIGGDLIKRKDIVGVFRALAVKALGRKRLSLLDPSNTFEWLMAQSERHGIVSAFYFICGRTDSLKDADYEIEHPAMRGLLRAIHHRGHEIGLHPSYNSYLSANAVEDEANRLLKVCSEEGVVQGSWGGRMHFLRWSQPATLRAWNRAGMTYDSTLGYADRVGFRCGSCHEYPAFDPVAQEILHLRIRPLIVMDVTLTSSSYLGLGSGDAALIKVKQLKDACRVVNGQFTLLWHNSNLGSVDEKLLYQRSLEC
jgi:hypothetical protein